LIPKNVQIIPIGLIIILIRDTEKGYKDLDNQLHHYYTTCRKDEMYLSWKENIMKKLSLAIVLSVLTPVLSVNAASGDAVATRLVLPRALANLGFQDPQILHTSDSYSELTFRTGGKSSATLGEASFHRGRPEDTWSTSKTLQALRALGYGKDNETEPARILNAFWGGDQLQPPIDTTPVGTLEAYFKSTGPNEDGTYKTPVAIRLLTAIEYGIATHDLAFIDKWQKRGATLTAEHLKFAETLYGNRCFKPVFDGPAYRSVVQSGDESAEAQQDYFNLILAQLKALYATQETAT
jgi:hypothetical protein